MIDSDWVRDVERDVMDIKDAQKKSEERQEKSHDTIIRTLGDMQGDMGDMQKTQTAFIAKVENDREKIEAHHGDLYGKDGSTGMKTEQDRLIQNSTRMGKLVWIIVASVVSLMVAGCASIFMWVAGG